MRKGDFSEMKQDDFKKFATDIILLAEIHGKEMSEGMLGMYFKALSDFSINQVTGAMSKAAKECKWFPKPVELIDFIQGKPIAIEDKAHVMATRILEHMKIYGHTKTPDLSDDPIAESLMSRRWPYSKWAADVLTSELKWWVKEFCEAYRSHSVAGIIDKPLIDVSPKLKEITDNLFNT